MVGTVLVQEEGVSYQAEAREAQARKQLLQQLMQRHGLRGLTEVAMAPSVGVGLTTMLQMAGLGTLRPNTVVAGWPQHATAERAADVVSLLQMSRAVNKACMFVKAQDDYLPADDARLSGTVDLWWILQEGGFLLLIGYLLHRHKVYRNCTLRLFTVAELTGSPAAIERQLEALLRALRIKCVVRVVEMPTSQLHTFMNQWTISRNMAQQAAQQLKVANQEALAFPATVDQLSGVAHNHPAESELLAAAPGDDEMWSLDQLAGAIGRESSQAALVIVNLPVPGVQDDEQPLKYVEMVNRLVSTIPTCVLVSGLSDGTQAISVYQQ
jgi:potassium/chloride transporter 4/5/6